MARACLGITEAGNFPTSIKTVALWFPKKERAFATSLFNSGANVGPILAPIIFPWITLTWGWQAAFITAGVAGFIWAGSVGGMIFPIVTGVLLDKFQASGNVTAGYSILFVICAFAYLMAFALNHLCAPKFELVSSKPRNL